MSDAERWDVWIGDSVKRKSTTHFVRSGERSWRRRSGTWGGSGVGRCCLRDGVEWGDWVDRCECGGGGVGVGVGIVRDGREEEVWDGVGEVIDEVERRGTAVIEAMLMFGVVYYAGGRGAFFAVFVVLVVDAGGQDGWHIVCHAGVDIYVKLYA